MDRSPVNNPGPSDWTEKYRPRTIDDVVGNSQARKELKGWANKWKSGKPRKKAVILAGKPGIGKTSSAIALAEDMGWNHIEMNASDSRNKDSIRDIVGRSAVDDTFSSNGDFIPYKEGKRTLLILDEADNVFGKEDRGGISEIRKTIDKTEQPTVLIANDYYDLRRRSKYLASKLKKIEFEPVKKKKIIDHLGDICEKEGLAYEPEVLDRIADRVDGDVRSAVRDLQTIATGREVIKLEHLNSLGHRNREAEIFPTLKTILKGNDPIKARESIWELDEEPRNLISWISENLPREYNDDIELSRGYGYLSLSDVYLGRVMESNYYRFWAYSNDLMTAGVCTAKRREHRGFTRYAFPTWIRKMMRSKGKRSMRKKLNIKIAEETHTTSDRVKSDIWSYFVYLFKNDESFRRTMTKGLDLEKEEASFILDVEQDSEMVKELYQKEKEVKKKRQSKDKRGSEKEEKKQRSLMEF